MTVRITETDGGLTVFLSGIFDTDSHNAVMEALQPVFDGIGGCVVVDCGELQYVSSSALRVFMLLRKKSAAARGTLLLRGLVPSVKQVFAISGFLPLFNIE